MSSPQSGDRELKPNTLLHVVSNTAVIDTTVGSRPIDPSITIALPGGSGGALGGCCACCFATAGVAAGAVCATGAGSGPPPMRRGLPLTITVQPARVNRRIERFFIMGPGVVEHVPGHR